MDFALATMSKIPTELLPFYAMIGVVRQGLIDSDYLATVIPSAQIARGFEYLGFKAQLVAACATLLQAGEPPKSMGDLGTWKAPPKIREDGTTDAHTVVWVDSFYRCIDLSVCQHPAIKSASKDEPKDTTPAVLPAEDLNALLTRGHIVYFRGRYGVLLMFTTPWTKLLDPLLQHKSDIVDQGGLALAHAVLDQLSYMSEERDLEELANTYSTLGDLLRERNHLPALQLVPPDRTTTSSS
jgi:hypothetical protein